MNLGPTVPGQTTPTVTRPGTQARGTAKTVLQPGQVAREGRPATRPPGPRPTPAPRPEYKPAPPPPAQGHPMLYVVLGGMAVLLVVAGGFIYWQKTQPVTPPTTIAGP